MKLLQKLLEIRKSVEYIQKRLQPITEYVKVTS